MSKHTIINMKIGYDNKLLPNILHTKFLGINIDSALSWRTRIEQRISKLREGIVTIWQLAFLPLGRIKLKFFVYPANGLVIIR